jgi:glycosyltransferase involved in cell wall biosynthesis
MQSVLVLVFSNLKHDARVKRQIDWLRKKYAVTVVCFDADETPGVTFLRIPQTRLTTLRKGRLALALALGAYKLAYRIFHNYGYLKGQLNARYDVVVANDIDTLPLAFEWKGTAKVVFDAHEYAPRHFENNRIWRTFFQPFYIHLCKVYIPQTSAMFTVGEGLAKEYEKNFGVKPVIITNSTRYFDLEPSAVLPDKIRLVHHGIINPSRRLELMIEMMARLDSRFTLDMILMTSDYASPQTRTYIREFSRRAEEDPRIKILPSVRSDKVVDTIRQYDIGVFLIPPINFNYANTLPNKLFDFIQARLAIAIGPTPEMANIVTRYGNGVVAENFEAESLARELNALTADELVRFKSQSSIAARELNAERNEAIFMQVMDDL